MWKYSEIFRNMHEVFNLITLFLYSFIELVFIVWRGWAAEYIFSLFSSIDSKRVGGVCVCVCIKVHKLNCVNH